MPLTKEEDRRRKQQKWAEERARLAAMTEEEVAQRREQRFQREQIRFQRRQQEKQAAKVGALRKIIKRRPGSRNVFCLVSHASFHCFRKPVPAPPKATQVDATPPSKQARHFYAQTDPLLQLMAPHWKPLLLFERPRKKQFGKQY